MCEEVEHLGASIIPGLPAAKVGELGATTEAGENDLFQGVLVRFRGLAVIPLVDGCR